MKGAHRRTKKSVTNFLKMFANYRHACFLLLLIASGFVSQPTHADLQCFPVIGCIWIPDPVTEPPSIPSSISSPANVSSGSSSSGSWTVSWGTSTNLPTYELWESISGGSWARVYNGSATSYSVTNKTVPTNYRYRARACNTLDCSGYTAIKTTQLQIGHASSLTLPATNTSGSYSISWPSQTSPVIESVDLEEQVNSGSWNDVANALSVTSKSMSGKATADYSYRLTFAAVLCPHEAAAIGLCGLGQPLIPGYSETPKTIEVTRPPAAPATPSLANKSNNQDTSYTLNWGSVSGSTKYQLYHRSAAYGSSSYSGWSLFYETPNAGTLSKNDSRGDGHHQYRVRGCNVTCGSFSGTRTATVLTLPSSPSSLSLSNKSNNADSAYTLSWGTAGGRVTTYELYRRTAPYGSSNYGGWSRVHNAIGQSRNESVGDGQYQYRARACNESGCGGYTSTISLTVLKLPGAPSTPSISNKSSDADTSFTVSWSAGSGRNDLFELYRRQAAYGSSSYGSWSRIHNASGTSVNQTQSSGQYQYRVRGYNGSGFSGYSSIRSATVLTVSSTPGAISMTNTSHGSRDVDGGYTVNWPAAGGVVDEYRLERRSANYGSSSYSSWTAIYTGSALSRSESGRPDGHHQYRVRSCNASGCSSYTSVKQQDVLRIPAKPSNVSGPTDTDGRFNLSINYGSGYITSYQLQHAINGGSNWINAETGSGSPTSISLTRPAYDASGNPTHDYRFRIAACNLSGCSAYSNASGNIHVNPPGTPASISLSNVSHTTADEDGSYRLNWSAINSPDVNYTIEERVGAGAWQSIAQNHTALYLDISRTSQANYQYRVKGCLAGVGCGDTTNTLSVTVAFKPSVPVLPTTSSSNSANAANTSIDGSYTVHWVKPAGAVTHYFVQRDSSAPSSAITGTSSSYTNRPDGTVSYRVRACNDVVCSSYSAARSMQVLRTPGAPGAIQGPSTSDGNGGFTLTWAVASGTVERYETSRNSGGWIDQGNSLSLTESALSDGDYSYRVRACNALGCGTQTVAKVVSTYNTPGVPGSLSGENTSDDGDFALSWNASTGNVTEYELQQRFGDGSWTAEQTSNSTSVTLTNKGNGTYRYRVRACNGGNCSNYSDEHEISVIVPEPLPTNPLDSVAGYTLPLSDQGVGAVGGAHDVSNDGSANYSVSIPAAGGRGGLTPELSLNYSSSGGNTELGVGWDIVGLSRIHRCSKNFALDGEVNGLQFDATDQLCMDGQRLVSVAGTYGASGAEYRTLRENYSKIESLGVEGSLASTDGNSTDDGFRVRTRDGRTLYFGSTTDSRLARVLNRTVCTNEIEVDLGFLFGGWQTYCAAYGVDPSNRQTYQWMLSRIEDKQGNSIEFIYENADVSGEQRISEASYNDGLHRIAFNWEDRPDTSEAYFAGSMLNQYKRLANIVSYSDTTALRSLHLTYSNAGSTGHSKITQIDECAGGTTSNCLQPTIFDWEEGEAGYTGVSLSSNYSYTQDRPARGVDINGDGFGDVLSSAGSSWEVSLGGAYGMTDWVNTNTSIQGSERRDAMVLRYNNDERDDLLISRNNRWYVLLANDATDNLNVGFLAPMDTGIANTGYDGQPKMIDMNGDGRADLLYAGNNGYWYYRLMTATGFGNEVYTGQKTGNNTTRQNTLVLDYNADGLPDLLVPNSGANYEAYIGTGSGFRKEVTNISKADSERAPQPIDINGDGLTDLIFRTSSDQIVYVLNRGGSFGPRTTISGVTATDTQWRNAQVLDYNADGRSDLWVSGRLITCDHQGTAAASVISIPASTYFTGTISQNSHTVALDYNGDGLDDLMVLSSSSKVQYTHRGKRPDYLTSITNGMGVESSFIYYGLHEEPVENGAPVTDFYLPGTNSTYPLVTQNSASYVVRLLTQSDGLGGVHTTSYKYRGLRTHVAGLGSLGFASMITRNEETGIQTEVTFSQDYAANQYGSVLRIETTAPGDNVTSLTENVWQTVWENTSANGIDAQRHRVELQSTEVIKRDLNGAFLSREMNDYSYDAYGNADTITSRVYGSASGGSLLRTSVTNNDWYNDAGNNWLIGLLTRAEVTVTDHSENAPALQRLSTFEYNFTTGRKVAEQIRNPDNNQILLNTRYGENASGQFQQDSFGNLLATTVTGPDFATRSSSMTYDSAHGLYPIQSVDALGHSTQQDYYGDNEYGNGAYPGKLRLSTSANGIQTLYQYDDFGRAIEVISAYGTAAAVTSYTRYRWCGSGGGCPVDGSYTTTQFTQGGIPVHTDVDLLGRALRKRTLAMDGRELWVDYEYDHLGHNVRVSEPYFSDGIPLWTTVQYDILGRAIQSTEPSGRVDTVTYNGLTTTSVMDVYDKAQSKMEVRNPLNNLVSVTDTNNQTITYDYDSLGRQTRVNDPSGNQISINYNALGHKTSMNDPDKGTWSYTYNALGELITQTDAKGQTTCNAYDVLGRPIQRVDNYTGSVASAVGQNAQANQGCAGSSDSGQGGAGLTLWTYHPSNASNPGQIGQLASLTSPDYSEIPVYDNLGRVSSATTTIKGQSFEVETTYDALSRPDVVTYPASSGTHSRLQVQTRYNALGFSTGTYSPDGSILYSRPEAVDSRGNITNTYYGNGVRTTKVYDAARGFLDTIQSEQLGDLLLNGGPSVQNIDVDFDNIGNLIHRSNTAHGTNGFSEDYQYDNLNRLVDATSDYGNGNIQNTRVEYDDLGNITYKSLVGDYTYGTRESGCAVTAGPHAVTSITPRGTEAGKNAAYCYDANGNMISGDGRSMSYTSFDKPYQISKGPNTTSMHYGAGRQLVYRYDVVDTGATNAETETWLVGGYERVIHVLGDDIGKVEERHYVGGSIVTYTHDADGNTARTPTEERRRFTHTDHLGSITAITDEIGTVVERFSFDAWGKRRAAEMLTVQQILAQDPHMFGSDPLGLKSEFTEQGFTGHQQLDGVGIIHMGGRIYDAELGRFLQADPFVQDRTNLQALNRYSYVENNPLSYTDPSGYFLKKLFKKIGKFLASVFKPITNAIKRVFQAIARVKFLSTVISVALNFIPGCQGWCTTVFNSALTAANGGTIRDILKGAAIGAVVSYIGGQISEGVGKVTGVELVDEMGQSLLETSKAAFAVSSAGQAIASGIASKAQGAKFVDGVKGAIIGAGINILAQKAVSWVRDVAQRKADLRAASMFAPDCHSESECAALLGPQSQGAQEENDSESLVNTPGLDAITKEELVMTPEQADALFNFNWPGDAADLDPTKFGDKQLAFGQALFEKQYEASSTTRRIFSLFGFPGYSARAYAGSFLLRTATSESNIFIENSGLNQASKVSAAGFREHFYSIVVRSQ